MIDYTHYQNSFNQLVRFWENYIDKKSPDASDKATEIMKVGLVHSFQICFEAQIKILRRYLIDEMGTLNQLEGAKPILRAANENNLLPSPVEQWFTYVNVRNAAAHDHDMEKANDAVVILPDYIEDSKALFQNMKAQP